MELLRASASSTPQLMSSSVRSAGRLVVNDRERAQILMPHRQHPAVVVAALRLDGGDVAGQRADLLLGQLVHPLQVDHELGRAGDRGWRRVAWQQFGDRDSVELGQLGELLDGDGTVTALVGAHDDGLPPAAGLLLNTVQRESLLRADGAQSRAQGLSVLRWHFSSVSRPVVAYGNGYAQ